MIFLSPRIIQGPVKEMRAAAWCRFPTCFRQKPSDCLAMFRFIQVNCAKVMVVVASRASDNTPAFRVRPRQCLKFLEGLRFSLPLRPISQRFLVTSSDKDRNALPEPVSCSIRYFHCLLSPMILPRRGESETKGNERGAERPR